MWWKETLNWIFLGGSSRETHIRGNPGRRVAKDEQGTREIRMYGFEKFIAMCLCDKWIWISLTDCSSCPLLACSRANKKERNLKPRKRCWTTVAELMPLIKRHLQNILLVAESWKTPFSQERYKADHRCKPIITSASVHSTRTHLRG